MFQHQPFDRSAILNILNCRCIVPWHLLTANSKLVENFEPDWSACGLCYTRIFR